MNYLEKIPEDLRKRIAHNFDFEYFKSFARRWEWFKNKLVSRHKVYIVGIERLKQLFEEDIVIYLPNHRSLYDFVAIGYLFWEKGMRVPRFAAGENLFFGPYNRIWRKLGAYAVDRGNTDWDYRKAVVEYENYLTLEERCDQVNFFGGGRSYTGRLQEPKLGLLGVIWRAAQKLDVNVIAQPIFLDYNRVIEEKYFGKLKKYKEEDNYFMYVWTDIKAFSLHFLKQVLLIDKLLNKEIDLVIEFGKPFNIKECKSKKELGDKISMALKEMACEDLKDELILA